VNVLLNEELVGGVVGEDVVSFGEEDALALAAGDWLGDIEYVIAIF
jgi:hypothetical protein